MTSSSKCKCREVIIFYSVQKKKSFFTYSVLSAPRVKKQLESISRKQLASRVVGITHTKNTTPRRRELRLLYLHTCIIWIFLPRAVNYFLTFFICPVKTDYDLRLWETSLKNVLRSESLRVNKTQPSWWLCTLKMTENYRAVNELLSEGGTYFNWLSRFLRKNSMYYIMPGKPERSVMSRNMVLKYSSGRIMRHFTLTFTV